MIKSLNPATILTTLFPPFILINFLFLLVFTQRAKETNPNNIVCLQIIIEEDDRLKDKEERRDK